MLRVTVLVAQDEDADAGMAMPADHGVRKPGERHHVSLARRRTMASRPVRATDSIRHELPKLLGVPVEVLTPKALPEKSHDAVAFQAVPVGAETLNACQTTPGTFFRRSSGFSARPSALIKRRSGHRPGGLPPGRDDRAAKQWLRGGVPDYPPSGGPPQAGKATPARALAPWTRTPTARAGRSASAAS
jgi:hypothetical protein